MASSLILNKRITTTVAKAKALRKYVEPLITKSKDDTTHSRRVVMSYLQNKESLKSLFGEVASRVTDRKGGYTRIIKIGEARLGDGSEMCMMELVDFNEVYKKDSTAKKAKTRRSRRGKKSEAAEGEESVEAPVAEAEEKKPKKAKSKKEKE
jgi:large subunit ribosomal protein L17